jgi:hypothetical protein
LRKDALLEVFVHKITPDDGGELYLISNVEADARSSGRLYQRRYDVEFDIRDLKVTMDTENIQARQLDTVLKELLHARAETLADWEKAYTTALISASRRRLPNRPQPRSYPRAAHPRRPKTSGAQKA